MLRGWKLYGKVGLLIIAAAEILLFLGVEPFTVYFTPIVWTGYILLVDSLVYRIRGESFLSTRFKQFLALLPLSIGFWYVFEFYNLFLKNWHYVGLPESKFWRYLGYFWSFATIWPAILLTYQLLLSLGLFQPRKANQNSGLSQKFLTVSIIVGFVLLVWPLVFPSPYLAAPVWLGFVLFLDPINYLWGEKSIFKDWATGKRQTLYTLFASGLICGILWEFWNYWAEAKWKYAIPLAGGFKIFEMPAIGYLGFLAFACEVYIMYNFATGVWHKLKRLPAVAIEKSPDGANLQT